MSPLLEMRNITKHFGVSGARFSWRRERKVVRAVDGVSLQVEPNRTLAIVGESGCGKTTLARLMLSLDRPTDGEVLFGGKNLAELSKAERREYRASVQAVFQDPYASMNPRMTMGAFIEEPLLINAPDMRADERRKYVAEMMARVGLEPERAGNYPHQFSGGQRQRGAIARAMSLRPALIVLDEPVASLDVSMRAQVTNLLIDLGRDEGVTYVLISHDLANVSYMSDDIAVMYLGKLIEFGPTEQVLEHPAHPYTRLLLAAARLRGPDDLALVAEDISKEMPSAFDLPSGCRFRNRCPEAMPICAEVDPPPFAVDGVRACCHLYGP